MVADPFHRECQTVLVAAFGHQVEDQVRTEERFEAAPVGGVGVEDVAAGILVE
jgi:hypothetical protein